jgi:hypothetical protein
MEMAVGAETAAVERAETETAERVERVETATLEWAAT